MYSKDALGIGQTKQNYSAETGNYFELLQLLSKCANRNWVFHMHLMDSQARADILTKAIAFPEVSKLNSSASKKSTSIRFQQQLLDTMLIISELLWWSFFGFVLVDWFISKFLYLSFVDDHMNFSCLVHEFLWAHPYRWLLLFYFVDGEEGKSLPSQVAMGLGLYSLALLTCVGNAMVVHAIRTEKSLRKVSYGISLF